MPLPFAVLAARMNLAVVRTLADARASIEGGPAFSVGMEDAYMSALDVASSGPACFCEAAEVQGVRTGRTIAIDRTVALDGEPGPLAQRFTISSVEADGGGLVVLRLRKA